MGGVLWWHQLKHLGRSTFNAESANFWHSYITLIEGQHPAGILALNEFPKQGRNLDLFGTIFFKHKYIPASRIALDEFLHGRTSGSIWDDMFLSPRWDIYEITPGPPTSIGLVWFTLKIHGRAIELCVEWLIMSFLFRSVITTIIILYCHSST